MEFKRIESSHGRQAERDQMVREQIIGRGITNPDIIRALQVVPRHKFVPEAEAGQAYEDHPLPIGFGQTISQPYIVAFMTEVLRPQSHHRVLEIGMGSGYQAAVLSQIVDKVFTIEIVEPLAQQASKVLESLGITNVFSRSGDGYQGWPEEAPFDAIILAAAPDHIPLPLLDQVRIGGRLVVPLGTTQQQLLLMTRNSEGWQKDELLSVSFVPMTGKAEGLSSWQDKEEGFNC